MAVLVTQRRSFFEPDLGLEFDRNGEHLPGSLTQNRLVSMSWASLVGNAITSVVGFASNMGGVLLRG